MVSEQVQSTIRQARVNLTRSMILDGALDLFLEEGFEKASINALVKRVACSKETIYKYFTNKEGLLFAAIDKCLDDILVSVVDLDIHEKNLKEGLEHVSYKTLEMLCVGKYAPFRMLIYNSAVKRPELGHEYYDYIDARSYRILATFFKEHIEKGNLKAIDPNRLAKYFWGMMLHNLLFRMDTQKTPTVSPRAVRRHADQVIDDFLIAFEER